MKEPLRLRRYLTHFQSHNLPQVFADVAVVGSGVAGLSAALEAAERCDVIVVTKADLKAGCTSQAQGGIAGALAPGDTPAQHLDDTVSVGVGLCDEDAVKILTDEAPQRLRQLIDLGVRFDREGEELAFAREGGHRRARILHANGDATGVAVEDVLASKVLEHPSIRVMEQSFAVDLLTSDGVCQGALISNAALGAMIVRARQTILANGGSGRLFRETTNPEVATGDGLAMAYRAGAVLRDLEFFQFHPTALYVAGASRCLISEALRGDGAVLRNRNGERFMTRYHPDAELAPRDTVSRSIVQEMKRTGHTCVYVDITDRSRAYLERRFPTIAGLCDRFDLDVAEDLIPVRPAAHYQIGGVTVDAMGRTNIAGLLACGEVACTGVHGANRLGSNSLLEGLVFGRRSGAAAAQKCTAGLEELPPAEVVSAPYEPAYGNLNIQDVASSLRSLMWRSMGVERDGRGMDEAMEMITFWCHYVADREFDRPGGWELQNLLTAARLMVTAAREREESRGVHYRSDFPETSEAWRRHIVITNARDDVQ
ncbi:MAG: L-aspartate oxidase [Candidatus Brocadiia bacterium]|jgi:L-aspartate oxidase|nr:L-aspartate oxidase [Candidatus Brocadiia bacterium]